ncbi:unnamed protein product, partial [Prorocentrum cordatum]
DLDEHKKTIKAAGSNAQEYLTQLNEYIAENKRKLDGYTQTDDYTTGKTKRSASHTATDCYEILNKTLQREEQATAHYKDEAKAYKHQRDSIQGKYESDIANKENNNKYRKEIDALNADLQHLPKAVTDLKTNKNNNIHTAKEDHKRKEQHLNQLIEDHIKKYDSSA